MQSGSTVRSRLSGLPVGRFGRRRFLASAGLTGFGLAAVGLVGCSSSSNNNGAAKPAASSAASVAAGSATRASGSPSVGGAAAATPSAVTGKVTTGGTPKVGGSYRQFGDLVQEPNNPTTSANTAAAFWLFIGDRAIDVDPKTNALVPSLIEKWEQPQHDQIVMHVRSTAKWHNKTPVNGRAVAAEDIAQSLLAHAGRLDQTGGKAVYPRQGNFSGVDTIAASDPATVMIKLKTPSVAFLPSIADWRLPMFPQDQLTIGFDDSNKLIGSGPWVADPGFSDGKDFSGGYKLTRNPSYWDSGKPYFNTIESMPNQDQAARTNAFIGGMIDSLATFRSPKVEIDGLLQRKADAQYLSWKFGHWHYTRFNTTKAPWKDPRARRAIFLALNHAAMGDGFYGKGNWQFTGPLVYTFFDTALQPDDIGKLPGWNTATKDQDIAMAKQLLSAAGYPDGDLTVVDLVFNLPMNAANSTRLQQQLQQVWPKMKVTIDAKPDSATFYGQTAKLDVWDLQCASIYPVPDPVTELIGTYASTGGRNYGKYANPDVDAKLTSALQEFDPAQLKSKLLDIQKQLIDEMPNMNHYAANLSALFQSHIRGLDNAVGPGVSSQVTKLLWSNNA